MDDLGGMLAEIVGEANVLRGDQIADDYCHDEALGLPPVSPAAVVRPACTAEVAAIVALACSGGVALTGRGSGTGLSGACTPVAGGVVVSFERMNRIIELDVENHVAVVQPGVSLEQLDRAAGEVDLVLVIVVENRRDDRLGEDVEELARLIGDLGAIDVYVLPPQSGTQLIEARERAFWLAKAAGADDIIDAVVPRASIAAYMEEVAELARASGSLVAGCGHAGDGNVHLSVFQADRSVRHGLVHDILAAAVKLGGAISGEHGIGVGKKVHVEMLESPYKVALWRRIKRAFDPHGILNPGTVFDPEPEVQP